MARRRNAEYEDFFQNGRKAHRLAEVERQLAGEAIQQEHQLKAEERSAENIADHFPRIIPNTPIIEWLPGYYIHRLEWEAYRDGRSVVDIKEPRQTVDPELISYQWNHFVVNSRFPWKLEDHAIVYTFV
ncbi:MULTISPECIES: hypothetical protein [Enterobacter cloacae complex]|uniref:hypothetical protein n=1 Tax=Enterobacteriaceae TaxID=543 RepID=UPI0015E58174|nr:MULTISPECIES: hypothetical protein [Enterobacter cloacae complex]QLP69407.1 hypothetical protein HV076_18395 [Enterobacter hormaechei]UQQ50320.1 hypothetical protein MUY33_19510 [Enterobacter roggenkampii]